MESSSVSDTPKLHYFVTVAAARTRVLHVPPTLPCYIAVVAGKSSRPGGGAPEREGAQLDTAGLAEQLRERRRESRQSVRQAAAEAGVSFMTFSRVEAGSQPDLST